MKLVFIVADAMFDSAFPLIKRLKQVVDVDCVLEISSNENIISADYKQMQDGRVYSVSEIPSLESFSDLLPLHSTYVIKYYAPRSFKRFLRFSLHESRFIKARNADFVFYFNEPIQAIFLKDKKHTDWGMGIHDPEFHSSQEHKHFFQTIRKILFRNCPHFFVFSDAFVEPFSKAYGIKPENVHALSLGPYEHLCKNTITTNTDTNNGALNLLFFGKISQYKGLKYLLEAVRKLLKEGQNAFTLTIAGKGCIEDDVVDLHDSHLNIINRYIPDEELSSLIYNCDVVVCPYTDATQSGVIMSSYAFCKPVIATDVGGLKEMVRDKVHGCIIPSKDSNAIHDVIQNLINDRDIVKEWAKNIKNDYHNGYKSWDIIASRFLEYIDN